MTELDERLARIIARRRDEAAVHGAGEDRLEHERRLSHERVVNELPRLLAKLSGAVAELNDRLAEADMWVKLEAAEQTPVSEAVYTLSVDDQDDRSPTLTLTVDSAGTLRAMLCARDTRSLLHASSIFSIDRSQLLGLLVTFLEANLG